MKKILGYLLPTTFKGSAGLPQAVISSVKEFDGNVTPNSWIDDYSSFLLSMHIFLRQLQQQRPFEQHDWFLLCLDGHGSHTQIEVARLCCKHNIKLLVFPPHCSHIVQPDSL